MKKIIIAIMAILIIGVGIGVYVISQLGSYSASYYHRHSKTVSAFENSY